MAYNPAIDHLAVVTEVRATWDEMTPGPARAWTITNQVCLRLQAQGEDAGLLAKDSGNQFLGYSTDIVVYRDGHHYDCLINSEADATPAWQDKGMIDPTRWRPPLGDVPDVPDDPGIPPDTPEPVCPCGAEFAEIKALLMAVLDDNAATRHLLMTGQWTAVLSHKWLGTLSGTVGPMQE